MSAAKFVKTAITFLGSLALCLGAGYLGRYPAMPSMPAYYAAITRPVFSPPVDLFYPAWMISFFLMGIILFLILQAGVKRREVMGGLILFVAQALFLFGWAYNFFGTHLFFFAFLFVVALVAVLLCTVIQVSRFSVIGALVLLPYALWILYAAYLTYGIMTLNPINFGFTTP